MQAVKTRLLLALQATDKLADGLLCFSCVWPCIKKITIFWTGTAPIHILPCKRGLRDIPLFCISVLSTKTCRDNWLKPVCAWTDLVCTMYIHCIYMFIWCIYLYTHCTWVLHIISIYHYGICHCLNVCTALVIGMYYAIVQELVILYREVSDRDGGCRRRSTTSSGPQSVVLGTCRKSQRARWVWGGDSAPTKRGARVGVDRVTVPEPTRIMIMMGEYIDPDFYRDQQQ